MSRNLPIEKIRSFYHIEQRGVDAVSLNGKRVPAAPGFPVILTFGISGLSTLEALELPEWQQSLEKGEIIKTTGLDLVAALLEWDDDQIFAKRHCGRDRRTMSYIDNIKNSHGICDRKYYSEEEAPLLTNSSPVREAIFQAANLGQINGQWVYEILVQYSIDGGATTHFYFDHHPTQNDLNAANMLENFENYFVLKEMTFTCWECGQKTHWLDTPGDLQSKIYNHHEKYCGC